MNRRILNMNKKKLNPNISLVLNNKKLILYSVRTKKNEPLDRFLEELNNCTYFEICMSFCKGRESLILIEFCGILINYFDY